MDSSEDSNQDFEGRLLLLFIKVTNSKWSPASRPWAVLNRNVYEFVINWLTNIYISISKSIEFFSIYTWITLNLNNQTLISYSSVISAPFAFKQRASIAFKFNQMCPFVNSFVVLIITRINRCWRPQWNLNKESTFGPSLNRFFNAISIGCPGIVWSLRTSGHGLLCQRTTAHELCC